MPKFKGIVHKLTANLHADAEECVDSFVSTLSEINKIKLKHLSDAVLKDRSRELKTRARSGAAIGTFTPLAFALVRESARRVLGMFPFDVQVLAGLAMCEGRLVEMQTGEGKTLAATMPAYTNAQGGRGVHILTFSDYLARRDAEWMGVLYQFLGLTCGCVQDGQNTRQKQNAYARDITYATAKEAGFDYLRDFLCMEKENIVHRPFHYAIVDEADSILIDEARIPLVIAEKVPGDADSVHELDSLVRSLRPGLDFKTNHSDKDIYLTDSGLSMVENILGCGNLYDHMNLELLSRLNCALYANFLLQKDRDYIVRNGRVEIIDEFTGRIAENRHWPDSLQTAVETKEGLCCQSPGKIMGSVTMQNFISLYPKLSGMTGTAAPAARELYELYGTPVVMIPTNRPCIRTDHPYTVFLKKENRQRAVVEEVVRANRLGRPVLVGTASVMESEDVAKRLMNAGVVTRVLNAKNDEEEAKIIARAGEPGAVTISTNMAGRGVDIRLGGENEQQKEAVINAGGLYVIGTTLYESSRIDHQLRGRSGRQGDPGESRFFISLEDDLIVRHEIGLVIYKSNLDCRGEPITNPEVSRLIEKGRKYVEAYNADIRRQVYKYSYILEQQRRIIHRKRQGILMDILPLELLSAKAADRYDFLKTNLGAEALHKAEKQITLYYLNRNWSDYISEMACVRESIHLVVIGKKNPLDEFHRIAAAAFENMNRQTDEDIIAAFNTAEVCSAGINLATEGIRGPGATFTYLINENYDQYSNLPELLKSAATAFRGPLFSLKSLYKKCMIKK